MHSRFLRLYMKAYSLCISTGSCDAIKDLPYLSNTELIGVIKRLSKLGDRNGS